MKFCIGSRVQQTPEEDWRTYRPKCCGNNDKDENNSPKTLNDKNQALSQKFRQLICGFVRIVAKFLCKKVTQRVQKVSMRNRFVIVACCNRIPIFC